MFNFTRYTAILLEVFMLQDQLRKDPPDNPAEYVALVGRIEALMNEAAALLKNKSTITKEQIAELRDIAHRQNQQRSNYSAPTGEFPYTEELTSYPDESRLKSEDEIYQYRTEERFIVWGGFGRKPDADGWHLVKTMP